MPHATDLPAPASIAMSATLLPLLIAAISMALTLLALFRKETREDGQTPNQRLRKLEIEQANQLVRQQGFQVEIEDVADHAERERRGIVENNKRDHETLRELIKDVPNMRDLLSRMDERFLSTKEEMKSLALKMDQIVHLLTHK